MYEERQRIAKATVANNGNSPPHAISSYAMTFATSTFNGGSITKAATKNGIRYYFLVGFQLIPDKLRPWTTEVFSYGPVRRKEFYLPAEGADRLNDTRSGVDVRHCEFGDL